MRSEVGLVYLTDPFNFGFRLFLYLLSYEASKGYMNSTCDFMKHFPFPHIHIQARDAFPRLQVFLLRFRRGEPSSNEQGTIAVR